MKGGKLAFDRYHATMGNFSLGENAKIGTKLLADCETSFYGTFRKLPFAPCVGHERLVAGFMTGGLDVPRVRFLEREKAGLGRIAERQETARFFMPEIRCALPGTIMFPNEPFIDATGPFVDVQMKEVLVEHSFDMPMTVASNALQMRLEAGNRQLSDFSLRRDDTLDRACDVAMYSYIGGFDDTSNMEAAFLFNLNAAGTMAHYLVKAFIWFMRHPERDEQGKKKHFEQTAFERWLDDHPKGTTLLLDTIDIKLGAFHAIRAAKSSPKRRGAFKAVRIDSKRMIEYAGWVRAMLDANGLEDVHVILTSDIDAVMMRQIVKECPFVYGLGIGTKLAAEVEHIAGVIFKLYCIYGEPVLKCHEGKNTWPGPLQVWRCVDKDECYVKDIIAMTNRGEYFGNMDYLKQTPLWDPQIVSSFPLLQPFGSLGRNFSLPSNERQRRYVLAQAEKFRDIYHYPVEASPTVQAVTKQLVEEMSYDEMGEDGIVMVPVTW